MFPPILTGYVYDKVMGGKNEGGKFLQLRQKQAYSWCASHTLQKLQSPLERAGLILCNLGIQLLFPNSQSHLGFLV